MFGRKKRIIDELEQQVDKLFKGASQAIEQKHELARELRDMDNMVFQMANQPNWESMRPFFQRMAEASMRRKETESHRIASIMIPELERNYG